MPERRFPPPWSADDPETKLGQDCFIVRDATVTRWRMSISRTSLRFHDLRGSHETHLLDRGTSATAVAARCGHDPAVMLRSYVKRTRKADVQAAEIIGALSKGALG